MAHTIEESGIQIYDGDMARQKKTLSYREKVKKIKLCSATHLFIQFKYVILNNEWSDEVSPHVQSSNYIAFVATC